jgi:hypothetical protein
MHFLKEDLSPGNYEWNNDLIYNGEPSRRLYNRNDGNQLLFVINSYAAVNTSFDTKQGLQIQNLLKYQLPVDAKSEKSVLQWLKEKIVA